MTEQKLDLVEFASRIAAEAGAGAPEIVWGKVLNARSPSAVLHNMPHDPLCHAGPPGLACPANAPKYVAIADATGGEPGIDGTFNPAGNGHGPNVPPLADQIDDGPVILPLLEMRNIEFCRLFPPQAASHENREKRPISHALQRAGIGYLPECLRLIGCQPVAQTNAEVLRPFTRRMPAARSGLSKPESAASNARRLTAASLPLIVLGAS